MAQSITTSVISSAQEVIGRLKRSVGTQLFGLQRATDDLLIALMARGHILLEDVPGVGKTALAKSFAEALGLSFRRIQCTPDLLPADIVGGLVFDPKNTEFVLRKGPIFTNLLLVDEINRALPRTQSALLEAMAEGQVTIDGESHPLPQPFLVIATQNPIESQGVFPLPEAQLDRFLLKTALGYPSSSDDVSMLSLHLDLHGGRTERKLQATEEGTTGAADERLDGDHALADQAVLQAAVRSVHVTDDLLGYISDLVRATRTHADVQVGASPRAMIMLANAARAVAVLNDRDFVTPDDVQRIATNVLFHRLVLLDPATSTLDPDTFVKSLLATVNVPIEDVSR
ncbi:AAA family ATPase [Alicyclobacillus sp. ALC3]|uniref:AAA family ATPase n=1 Tax=Alicyclobacillus sp. ALC3 TaxID=2796143 RepID=UPI002377FD6A|nr:MoxR family ATPase [Alicyclobacillus sp. ALC3]WDL98304.1 MoxR family ATPase [Alicyclobacillus sp. ALC3]